MSDVPRNETDLPFTLPNETGSANMDDGSDVNCADSDCQQLSTKEIEERPITETQDQVIIQPEDTQIVQEVEAEQVTDDSVRSTEENQTAECLSQLQISQPELIVSLNEAPPFPILDEPQLNSELVEGMKNSEAEIATTTEYSSVIESNGKNGAAESEEVESEKDKVFVGGKEEKNEQLKEELATLDEDQIMQHELVEESTAPKAPPEDCTALAEEAIPKTSPTKSSISKIEQKTEPHSLHHIKLIQYKEKKVSIVTQNENGPCPLVAIINTLLLQKRISFPSGGHQEIVSAAKLMEYIGNAILENTPKNPDPELQLNYEQNMSDAMAVLPKLQTGLDVNVKFTGVHDFEYTTECIVFDLLNIRLYHGWLVDPQDAEIVAAVGQAGYNQLVEKVITYKCSNDSHKMTEALIIESFLERSASQLTYHGLVELSRAMNEGEVAVLFRNNHFSTILKQQDMVLQLVTDQGFLIEPNVVWETLNSIDGDGQFVDGYFRPVPPKPEPRPVQGETNISNLSTEQQIDQDFLVALSLQEDQPTDVATTSDFSELMNQEERTAQEARDAELARKLQEEEQQAVEAERETVSTAHPETPGTSGPRSPSQSSQSKKKENCIIL